MGKSALAQDVGWQLWSSGALLGGAIYVDLREAHGEKDVLGRFCAILDIDQQSDDVASEVVRQLQRRSSARAGGAAVHALLLVDNAEDSLQEERAGRTMRHLLSQVAQQVPGVDLLVTSRVALQFPDSHSASPHAQPPAVLTHALRGLATDAAEALVRSIVPDISDADAVVLATGCCGIPLQLRLVADALASGRLTLPEVHNLMNRPSRSGLDASAIMLTISSLPPPQHLALAQLSVFPAGFDQDDAAVIMGQDEMKAQAIVQVLSSHGLLLYDTASHHWVISAAVKAAAAKQHAGGDVLPAAERRFIQMVFKQLMQWGQMYNGKGGELALQLCRESMADVAAAFARLAAREPLTVEFAASLSASVQVNQFGSFCCEALALWRKPSTYEAAWTRIAKVLEGAERREHQLAWGNALCCLAKSFNASGATIAAEPVLRAALGARMRLLGRSHADTGWVMHNLGIALSAEGRYAEGEATLREALDVRRAALGPEHKDCMWTLTALASCVGAQGKQAEAEAMLREVLDIRGRVLGPRHPFSAAAQSALAACLDKQGKHAEAEPLHRSALDIRQAVLGTEHPKMVANLNALGACLLARGHRSEAKTLHQQALELAERGLGPAHPDTIASQSCLAMALDAEGSHAGAEALHRQVLQKQTTAHSAEHPATATAGTRLAGCLSAQQRHGEAEQLLQAALAVRRRLLGPAHVDSLSAMDQMAACLRARGDVAGAQSLLAELLKLRSKALGDDHPSTIATAEDLTACEGAPSKFRSVVARGGGHGAAPGIGGDDVGAGAAHGIPMFSPTSPLPASFAGAPLYRHKGHVLRAVNAAGKHA